MSHYKPYPAYKDSGVEWLGRVPEHWGVAPLCSMFERKKSTGYESEELLSVYRDYGVIPKTSREDNNNKASEDLSAYQLVEAGNLVANKMKTWQGSIAISKFRGIVSPAYFVYRQRHGESSGFLHHLFRSLPYITGYMSASEGVRVNQWDLNPELFRRFPVLIPPCDEQNEINSKLNSETTRIDTLIAKKTRFIELLKEKRQALITQAVTKGLNPNVKMKNSGVEWLGEVPEHWRVLNFQRCVYIAEGQVNPELAPYSDMMLIAPNHIESGTGRLIYTQTASEQNAESGKYFCQKGDVIYSKIRPGLRKVCISPDVCLCSADMYPLRGDKSVMNNYLIWFFLSEPFSAFAVLEADRVAMPKINRESLNALKLAIPPIKEQGEIVVELSNATSRIDLITGKTELSITLLKERRSALITAAVTGQIDLRAAA